MNIKIKKLRNDAVLPVRKTDGAIGFDLTVAKDICIEKTRQVIPLGDPRNDYVVLNWY